MTKGKCCLSPTSALRATVPLHERIRGDTVSSYHMHGSGSTMQYIKYSWIVLRSNKFIDEALLWGVRELGEQRMYSVLAQVHKKPYGTKLLTFAIIIIIIHILFTLLLIIRGAITFTIHAGPKLPASRSFSANENSVRNRMGTKRIGRLATEIFVPALCQVHGHQT